MSAESKKISNLEGQFLLRYASRRWPFLFGEEQPAPAKTPTPGLAAQVKPLPPVTFKIEDISTADDEQAALSENP
jgi:hypothetical protein